MQKIKSLAFRYISKKQITTFLYCFLFLSLSLFFHFNFSDNSDEGVILAGAWNIQNGKEIYTDFFEFIPPGSFYIILWAWKIIGTSYLGAKFISIIILALSMLGIYKISTLLSQTKLNIIPPSIFLILSVSWPIINHNTFNTAFIIWAVYHFLRYLNKPSSKRIILTGLLTSISTIILFHKSIFLIFLVLTFLIYSIILKKERSNYNLFLYISSLLIPIFLLFLNWPPSILFEHIIYFPFFNYLETNKLPLGPIFLLLFIVVFFFYQIKFKFNKKLLFLFLLQILLLLSAFQRPDFFHITVIIFPCLVILPIFLDYNFSKNKNIKTIVINSSLLLYIIITISITTSINYHITHKQTDLTEIKNFIDTHCKSNYIYAGPFIPGAYFHFSKLNPTSFDWLITNHQTENQFKQALDQIKEKQPDCAILSYSNVVKFKYNRNNIVDNYLRNNYKIIKNYNSNTKIYKIEQ